MRDSSALSVDRVERPSGAAADATVAIAGFQVLAEIARGGMGIIYRARDESLDRNVAIKILQPRFAADSLTARRFEHEARITAQLQHPGIPPVYQLGTLADGRPFLAMKLIEGQTFDELLKDRGHGTAASGRLVAAFEQVCQAVAYAHAHQIVHRDLKPANIMVGAFAEVQVMDWGLAKLVGQHEALATAADPEATTAETEILTRRAWDDATQAGSVLGTPAYMPPEQAIGAIDQIDHRSDVFGLGAVLCAILTGKPPYSGADSESTRQMAARAKLEDAMARLDGCGGEPGLVALCKRCLAVEKDDRPADAGEVAKEVARLRADAVERARQAELDRVRAEGEQAKVEAEAREQRKRQRVQWALAATVGLILLGGAAVGWWQDRLATQRRTEAANRDRDERNRLARNGDALAALLSQCEAALQGDDFQRAETAQEQIEQRLAEGGGDDLRDRIENCRRDLAMLRELNSIDDSVWTPIEGKRPDWKVLTTRWRQAFAGYGMRLDADFAGDMADRVAASSIRERLLTALDLWLILAHTQDVRAVLRLADPDSFRDAVRDAIAARNNARIVALINKPDALAQPSEFAAALGNATAIPAVRRREVIKTAIQAQPGNLTLLMAMGNTYPLGKRTDAGERVRWFQAAVAAHPLSEIAYSNLGHALRDKKDVEGAIAVLREAIRLDPKQIGARFGMGLVLDDKNDLDGAIAQYQEVIRLDPGYAQAQNNLGVIFLKKKDVERASAAFREAIRLDPNLALAHQNLGIVFLREKKDAPAAIAELKEAVRLDHQLVSSLVDLGIALKMTNDLDGAIASFNDAIRTDPMNANAHFALANAQRDKNDLPAAIASYRQAIRLNPKDAGVRNNLGVALQRSDDLAGAIASYKEALRLDPRLTPARSNLIVVLDSLAWRLATGPDGKRNGQRAVQLATEACELSKWKEPKYIETLAAAFAEAGNFDKAVEHQKKALSFSEFAATFGVAAQARLELYLQKMPYRGAPHGGRMAPANNRKM